MTMSQLPAKSSPTLPAYAGVFAMWWVIAGLSMLFFSSLLGYIIIRLRYAFPPDNLSFTPTILPIGALRGDFPLALWISTIVVIAGSITIQRAVRAVELERQPQLRMWTRITLVLGILFCLIQTPCLWQLLSKHFQAIATLGEQNTPVKALYGLIAVMIIIHALHLVGGIIHLAFVDYHAQRGRYDHERHGPVRYAAMYWHFLDFVWIVMFLTMFIAG
jgi:cytochrome c oxidase subunit III